MPKDPSLDQPLSKQDFIEILTEFKKDQDRQFAEIAQQFTKVDTQFAQIDRRFAEIAKQFAKIDKKFVEIDKQFDSLHTVMKRFSTALKNQSIQTEKNTLAIKSLKNHIDTVVDRVVADQQDERIEFAASVQMIPALREEILDHEERLLIIEKNSGRKAKKIA